MVGYLYSAHRQTCALLLQMMHVLWSVCLLGTLKSSAKTAEPTDMSFWRQTIYLYVNVWGIRIGVTWLIQWNDLCSSGDAGGRHHYCGNLLFMLGLYG